MKQVTIVSGYNYTRVYEGLLGYDDLIFLQDTWRKELNYPEDKWTITIKSKGFLSGSFIGYDVWFSAPMAMTDELTIRYHTVEEIEQ